MGVNILMNQVFGTIKKTSNKTYIKPFIAKKNKLLICYYL